MSALTQGQMPDSTPDEMRRALTSWRDEQLAGLLTVMIGLAAEKFPHELRKALGGVFDTSAIEESTRQAMERLAKVQNQAGAAHTRLRTVEDRIRRIEKRVDEVEARPATLPARKQA